MCFGNNSLDEMLWKLGPVTLVEYKNDLDKIGTKTPYELLTKKIKQVENRQEKLMENLI